MNQPYAEIGESGRDVGFVEYYGMKRQHIMHKARVTHESFFNSGKGSVLPIIKRGRRKTLLVV